MLLNINKVARLQEKSKGIFNVFTQTVRDLTEVNNEIEIAMEERREKIEKLEAEQYDLAIMETSNQKMIDKINTFINE